jgi:hypothetical protein
VTGGRRTAQVASLLASPSLWSSSSGTSSSISDAGRHGDFEFPGEPLELHMVDACLAEGSRLRLDVPEEQREELVFLIPKVVTLFVPDELHEFPRRRQPSRSISARDSTAQPHCLHESIVVVARERDQGGVALHCTFRRRRPRATRSLSNGSVHR